MEEKWLLLSGRRMASRKISRDFVYQNLELLRLETLFFLMASDK
jgi:hypothetical protein